MLAAQDETPDLETLLDLSICMDKCFRERQGQVTLCGFSNGLWLLE